MSIGNNIKILRTKYGLSQQDLADIAGVTNKAVSTWESNTKEPRMGAIEKIANHFGIKKSNLIDENGMELIDYVDSDGSTQDIYVKPLYGSIAAGTPIEMLEVEEYIEVPKNIALKYPKAFLLKVNGDSMNKVVPNNAYALITPQEEANNGDVVAVAVNGYDATLKRYYQLQHTTVLEPDSYNPEHIAKTFSGVEGEPSLRIIGKMVWFMSGYDNKY
ncbi:LexA family protein [Paenibacillus illinoisensis]|uniref:LexA family protein n=1 Tax=Paenibacillus illinoisensis TaxID=59845 RepID=A0ABW8I0P7_9BACL